ncbi:hypothetical protein B0H10DRAFT_1960532 [Mycena sp. CBHHK59/15]|nr:hypothetical protein B0H10DRAFT_1960532 [Mycena sp. CBHHK59/15]
MTGAPRREGLRFYLLHRNLRADYCRQHLFSLSLLRLKETKLCRLITQIDVPTKHLSVLGVESGDTPSLSRSTSPSCSLPPRAHIGTRSSTDECIPNPHTAVGKADEIWPWSVVTSNSVFPRSFMRWIWGTGGAAGVLHSQPRTTPTPASLTDHYSRNGTILSLTTSYDEENDVPVHRPTREHSIISIFSGSSSESRDTTLELAYPADPPPAGEIIDMTKPMRLVVWFNVSIT